jgi:hypothetical protein
VDPKPPSANEPEGRGALFGWTGGTAGLAGVVYGIWQFVAGIQGDITDLKAELEKKDEAIIALVAAGDKVVTERLKAAEGRVRGCEARLSYAVIGNQDFVDWETDKLPRGDKHINRDARTMAEIIVERNSGVQP